jgi:hypothetical protein
MVLCSTVYGIAEYALYKLGFTAIVVDQPIGNAHLKS